MAALQTALYSARRHDVTVYPLRGSHRKHGDYDLYLPDSNEIHHIIALAEGKKVVVHDEDASGGTTVHRAIIRLRQLLQRTDILGAVNIDSRSPKRLQDQGERWERVG